MKTEFSIAQLANKDTAEANAILRACVHCGFCNATCPTFLITSDELEGPRGRIYLMKTLLESGDLPSPETVRHIDNCLSCASCMTTCPSGVDYRRLVDQTRNHIEQKFDRPLSESLQRKLLNWVLPRPGLFRSALRLSKVAGPFKSLIPESLQHWLGQSPGKLPPPSSMQRSGAHKAEGTMRRRVLLHTGCAQKVVRPAINDAAIRLLTRQGCEVVIANEFGCCGALSHHLGEVASAIAMAKKNIDALMRYIAQGSVDIILSTASGCSPTLQDYPHLLRHERGWVEKAERVSALCADISALYQSLDLTQHTQNRTLDIAYHTPCSLTHNLCAEDLPRQALVDVGFSVNDVGENHICCGSAGSYSLLHADMSKQLLQRKIVQIDKLSPSVIATSNIGCLTQMASGSETPVVHVVELLDWATGGPAPLELQP